MSARHRVLIDATPARYGGTAYAIVQLAGALARAPGVERVMVAARAGSLVAGGVRPDVDLVALPPAGRFELARRIAWQARGLPELAREATVVLTPSGMLPRALPVPVVCYLMNPVPLMDARPGDRVRRQAIARTARAAAAVLVPSQHMRILTRAATGRDPAVVPLGVGVGVTSEPETHVRTGLLCVADLYRHKRHDLLLEAWERLPAPRPALRLIGDPRVDPDWADVIRRRVATLDGVTLEHGLRLAELQAAYRAAALFVLPSTRESFCLPLAEAGTSGLPGLVTDLPALRETGGLGAHYLRGDDPTTWARAIGALLADPVSRRELGEVARGHAARFSVAAMTAGVLERLPALAESRRHGSATAR